MLSQLQYHRVQYFPAAFPTDMWFIENGAAPLL
jgi:hypothetical protein